MCVSPTKIYLYICLPHPVPDLPDGAPTLHSVHHQGAGVDHHPVPDLPDGAPALHGVHALDADGRDHGGSVKRGDRGSGQCAPNPLAPDEPGGGPSNIVHSHQYVGHPTLSKANLSKLRPT